MTEYTDQDAILLLDELKKYWLAFEQDLPHPSTFNVSQLAGDLLDSLPDGLITPNYSVLDPQSYTAGSHYRTS